MDIRIFYYIEFRLFQVLTIYMVSMIGNFSVGFRIGIAVHVFGI